MGESIVRKCFTLFPLDLPVVFDGSVNYECQTQM